MKQYLMFGDGVEETDKPKYSQKISSPVYSPSGKKPHHLILCDDTKTKSLIREIKESSISDEDKEFLIKSAYRHMVFNYEQIANYYAHSSPEVQRLMEKSALVIIDFDKAIESGYVKICEEIKGQFLEEYSDEL